MLGAKTIASTLLLVASTIAVWQMGLLSVETPRAIAQARPS